LRSTRKRVAVLSADYKKAYPVVRSLKKHGYTVVAVFSKWRSYVFSRFINERVRVYGIGGPRDMEVLLRYLRSRYGVDIVVPISFEDFLYLSKVEDSAVRAPRLRNVDRASDKFELCKICEEVGTRYPRTLLIKVDNVHDCAREIENKIGYPMVVKGRGDAARPSYVSDIDDLLEILSKNVGREVLVQEYVPGIGCGYFAVAVDGRPLVEYTHVRLLEEKASGGPSVSSKLDFDPELIRVGRRFLSYFKWTGPVMIEMKRHVETGEIYVIEINPKFWGSLELSYSSGLDLTCELLRTCGEDVQCVHNVHRGRVFTWIIAAMHYLGDNAWIYMKMLKNVMRKGIVNVSDIHVDDPPELLYGITTRLVAVMTGKFSRSRWRRQYHELLVRKIARAVRSLRLIIFDLDGTLVNIPINWSTLRDRMCGELRKSRTFNVMSLIARCREADVRVRKIEIEASRGARVRSSVAHSLMKLKEMGLKLALATKQCREAAYTILENSRIEKLFDIVMTRDDTMFKSDQVLLILRKLGERPENSLMIGDSIVDYYAACRNTVRFIAVTSSKYRMQMFTELNVPCLENVEILLKMLTELLDRNVHSINA